MRSQLHGELPLMLRWSERLRARLVPSHVDEALVCDMAEPHIGRYWGAHNGRLPGSALELPFVAPADHFLELEA